MYYTDLIDSTPVTMTARQLRLAIQEAHLAAREQALNEAAELVAEQLNPIASAPTLRQFADDAASDREDLQREIDAANGLVR
jgi:hypothetical protein